MSQDDLVGIVMAAGESARFGSPKQLLPLGDTTLLGHVVQNVNRAKLDRVVVVLGREAPEVRRSFDAGSAQVVDNLAYGTGCASSLLAGLDTAGECAGIVLILGDQPGLEADTIDQVIDTWRERKPWASATRYRGRLGHPLIFSSESFEDLRRLHGDKAVWKLIEEFPERVLIVDIDAELPADIDEPEDYEQLISLSGRKA